MLRMGKVPVTVLLLVVAAFCGVNFLFDGNEGLRALGISSIHLVTGAISFVWLFRAYRNSSVEKQQKFWLLLSLGVLWMFFGNFLWFVGIIQGKETLTTSPDFSYFLWLLGCISFLAALVYKIQKISRGVDKSVYFFNIVTLVLTATAISAYYYLEIIMEVTKHSIFLTITISAYLIIGLSILFSVATLYYLRKFTDEKNLLLYVIIGFFLQVIADSGYVINEFVDSPFFVNATELIWLISILFIGFAGYHAEDKQQGARLKIKNAFEEAENFFPYTNILILLILMVDSYNYDFNALSIGLLLIFLMILGRQLIILRENKKLMSEYKYLAYHDPLTDLDNRAGFRENLEEMLSESAEKNVALLLIDLDRFKMVNDTLGHHNGDRILIETAQRLKNSVREDDWVYRLGGDEFVIILQDGTKEKCSIVAKRIVNSFRPPFLLDEHEIGITPSIGISIAPEHSRVGEDLLKYADAAMYLTKGSGKNGYRFFNQELNESIVRKAQIESALKNAIKKNQFTLHYQPKVDLRTREMVGVEALLRWEHPELGNVSPAEFIPVAEETGQMVPIGKWVLKEACMQHKMWQERGFTSLGMAVNVSEKQFQHDDFLNDLREVLQETGLNPKLLELEITESIMKDITQNMAVLKQLREIGVKTGIDDFGMGYSSLNVLQQLPIDTLKIDKVFIDGAEGYGDKSMLRAMIAMGLNLNLTVVAEGIELEEQVDVLLENNCTIGQGFLFSRALPAKELEEILIEAVS